MADLESFRRNWNNHKLSTEHPRRSPLQLLHERRQHSQAINFEEFNFQMHRLPEYTVTLMPCEHWRQLMTTAP